MGVKKSCNVVRRAKDWYPTLEVFVNIPQKQDDLSDHIPALLVIQGQVFGQIKKRIY